MELRNFFKKKEIKDTAQNEQDFYQKNPRKKFLKIFAAASLALITCATTLLATAPFGTSTANAATNSNLSNNTKTTSPLGLDPENDPIIYENTQGLQIKLSSTVPNSKFSAYPYFTMGTYGGHSVNWLIIGVGSNCGNFTSPKNSGQPPVDDSPASKAIRNDGFLYNLQYTSNTANPIVNPVGELASGTILCLSECTLGTSIFNNGSGWSNYTYGNDTHLHVVMDDTPNRLNIDDSYLSWVIPQNITTVGPASTETVTKSFFPLAVGSGSAAGSDNFRAENYLTTPDLRIAYAIGTTTATNWWTRSCRASNNTYMRWYSTTGENTYGSSGTSNGVRPACVIKLGKALLA